MRLFTGNRRISSGFSMIEMLVVFAFIAILGGVAMLNLVRHRSRINLDSATKELSALLRTAQSRAAAQELGTMWGVHMENSTATTPFYSLFSGTYSASNTIERSPLPSSVTYGTSSIAQGSFVEVIFREVSGLPSSSVSITLNLSAGNSVIATSAIRVSTSGLISF